MKPIKVYLDEDVHTFIAEALRLRGYNALTTLEAGRQAATDADQIRFATEHGFAILSYNISHFPRLHHEVVGAGASHSGIIVATQDDPKSNLRALLSLISHFTAADLVDQLVYLNNWM